MSQLIANKTMWEYSFGLQIINNKGMCYDYTTHYNMWWLACNGGDAGYLSADVRQYTLQQLHRKFVCWCQTIYITAINSNSTKLLTHWGRVMHICISKLTTIGSDIGLSPGRRQAIIWTNAGILSTGALGTNFSENLIEILTFSFTKMRLKVSSVKWRPFCLSLNLLINPNTNTVRCYLAWPNIEDTVLHTALQ